MEVSFIKSAFNESHYPPSDMPEIAFAGRSNVGKSSLINVVVNRKKMARTSSTPGRTQAINFFSVKNSIYLVDLPGYGFARVPLNIKRSWGIMVESYLRNRDNLRGVVVIIDIRRDPNKGDLDLMSWLNQYGIASIIVLTKIDKLSRQKAHTRAKQIARELEKVSSDKPILFSAKTREGRDKIWDRMNELISIT